MALTLELSLLLLAILGLGAWGIVSGIRLSRAQPRQLISAQQLSSLAQPYRGYMGEALNIYQDVAAQSKNAPGSLKRELNNLAQRLEQLIARTLPRAKHGTSLAAYLLELKPDEPQFAKTQTASKQVEQELQDFVSTLKTLRGKVYQILTDATNLGKDGYLAKDLEDALIEVEALETAFSDIKLET